MYTPMLKAFLFKHHASESVDVKETSIMVEEEKTCFLFEIFVFDAMRSRVKFESLSILVRVFTDMLRQLRTKSVLQRKSVGEDHVYSGVVPSFHMFLSRRRSSIVHDFHAIDDVRHGQEKNPKESNPKAKCHGVSRLSVLLK